MPTAHTTSIKTALSSVARRAPAAAAVDTAALSAAIRSPAC
jgi:hypothetical protein